MDLSLLESKILNLFNVPHPYLMFSTLKVLLDFVIS